MAVPRHDHLPTEGDRTSDRRKKSARAPVDEVERPLAPVNRGKKRHPLCENARRIVKIVESVNLGNIHLRAESVQIPVSPCALVTGHMKRDPPLLAVFTELGVKRFLICFLHESSIKKCRIG